MSNVDLYELKYSLGYLLRVLDCWDSYLQSHKNLYFALKNVVDFLSYNSKFDFEVKR